MSLFLSVPYRFNYFQSMKNVYVRLRMYDIFKVPGLLMD